MADHCAADASPVSVHVIDALRRAARSGLVWKWVLTVFTVMMCVASAHVLTVYAHEYVHVRELLLSDDIGALIAACSNPQVLAASRRTGFAGDCDTVLALHSMWPSMHALTRTWNIVLYDMFATALIRAGVFISTALTTLFVAATVVALLFARTCARRASSSARALSAVSRAHGHARHHAE